MKVLMHACTRSELRGASCEDWKSAFRQSKIIKVGRFVACSAAPRLGALGRNATQWVRYAYVPIFFTNEAVVVFRVVDQ
jgi:hypothetical protein